jgi:hypothetical protein
MDKDLTAMSDMIIRKLDIKRGIWNKKFVEGISELSIGSTAIIRKGMILALEYFVFTNTLTKADLNSKLTTFS